MIRRRIVADVLAVVVPLVLLLVRCGTLSSLAGGASEETNAKVMGTLVDENGNGSAQSIVRLIPALYNPATGEVLPASLVDTADEGGKFVFERVAPGSYNLEAAATTSPLKAFAGEIAVHARDTTVHIADTLHRTGQIEVVFPIVQNDTSEYAYLSGTSLYGRVRNNAVLISGVPAGIFSALCSGSIADTANHHSIQSNVTVHSSQTTTVLDNSGFAGRKGIFLNTTPSGANVMGDVYNFPVLVRLTGATFVFAQAKGNGGDVRFAKENGTPLAYEIERWDSADARAEIWVKLDTVYGDNNTQHFMMNWGAPVASASNSGAVFATGAGFQGVWHLAETGTSTALDATVNGFNGTPEGMSAASPVPGMIGCGRAFDGKTSGITLPGTASGKLNFYGSNDFSLSAWVYADSLDSLFHPILIKSNYQYALQCRDYNDWEFFNYQDSVWHGTQAPAKAGAWVFIAGVRESGRQYLYVNGVLVSDTISQLVMKPQMPDDTTQNVTIGFLPEMARYWSGVLDEIRISDVPLSADWILLCYMNQKPDDALVKMK